MGWIWIQSNVSTDFNVFGGLQDLELAIFCLKNPLFNAITLWIFNSLREWKMKNGKKWRVSIISKYYEPMNGRFTWLC